MFSEDAPVLITGGKGFIVGLKMYVRPAHIDDLFVRAAMLLAACVMIFRIAAYAFLMSIRPTISIFPLDAISFLVISVMKPIASQLFEESVQYSISPLTWAVWGPSTAQTRAISSYTEKII